VFDSPRDTIIFDVGHQTYVHKLITGRAERFSTLRQRDGLSGYPSRAESEHDVLENSHASASLSWADGIAKARQLTGQDDRHVVAVIGDGALTGGMSWEALNTIAADTSTPPRRLVIIVNDNGRSYAPTVGGFAAHLYELRTTSGYEKLLSWGKETLRQSGAPGRAAYSSIHGVKRGLEDMVSPSQTGLSDAVGIKSLAPVGGHDLRSVANALQLAKQFDGGPIIVHMIAQKGHGFDPAVNDAADQFHSVGVIDPVTGRATPSKSTSWTSVFGAEMCVLAADRSDIVAIWVAMVNPVG